MIRCLLAQISRNQNGQLVRKELEATGETIQIGRAAGCKILLLDHRVNFHHATIHYPDGGKLFIEAEKGADITINGSPELSTELSPGTHILVGPYELIAETPTDDYDLVLSVEMVHPLPDDHEHISANQAPVTLAGAGLSKRKLTLWLAGAIALIFLILPMIPASSPTLPKWVTGLQASINKSWQLGEMSRGHHLISAKCDACHLKPFKAVPDKACENCHKTVARHIEDKTLHANAFKDMRCGECHHEHRGEIKEVTQDAQCVACHAKIKKKNDKTKLANIRDFSKDHPAFSLTFKTGHKDSDVVRISQIDKAKLVEKSGLKFSHKVHLDKEGVSSPEGDTVLECRDCHQLDAAGIRFRPISMEKNCQQSGCHALNFKPPVLKRQIPHSSEQKLMAALREYYATTAIGKVAAGEKFQCGTGIGVGKNQIERALDCANHNAYVNAEILFKPNSGCGECHEITPDADDKDVPWKVTPVTITSHWLRNSHFTHAKHSTAKCTECHDKTLSEKSSDVAIPAIEKCRECHVGNKRVKNRLNSGCDNCHSFHNKNAHSSSVAAH
ncbi:MAG: hypothetical protein Q7T29_17680 [Gallionella sp.]|nr:hypothetical protein [Gallionella sp.]